MMLRFLGTYLTDMKSGGLYEIVYAAYNPTEGTLTEVLICSGCKQD